MTDQNKTKSKRTVAADVSPLTNRPGQETICRACGEPLTVHEPGCPMAAEVSTLGVPPSGGRDPSTGHVCMASGCGTLIGTEDFFCEYHFQKLPPDLCWQYVKSADGPPRQMILQQMVDHFTHAPVADPYLLEALQAIEQLTRGTISTHVHTIAFNAIQRAEAR